MQHKGIVAQYTAGRNRLPLSALGGIARSTTDDCPL
jgi:hypothetical protein